MFYVQQCYATDNYNQYIMSMIHYNNVIQLRQVYVIFMFIVLS